MNTDNEKQVKETAAETETEVKAEEVKKETKKDLVYRKIDKVFFFSLTL